MTSQKQCRDKGGTDHADGATASTSDADDVSIEHSLSLKNNGYIRIVCS